MEPKNHTSFDKKEIPITATTCGSSLTICHIHSHHQHMNAHCADSYKLVMQRYIVQMI